MSFEIRPILCVSPASRPFQRFLNESVANMIPGRAREVSNASMSPFPEESDDNPTDRASGTLARKLLHLASERVDGRTRP